LDVLGIEEGWVQWSKPKILNFG